MNDIDKNISKKRARFTFSVLVIAITVVGFIAAGTYQISRFYLNKAEKSSKTESIQYYETANLFWTIPDTSLLSLADLQYSAGDYLAARDNYGLMETKASYLGSTKAEYAIGNYSDIAESDGTNPNLETDQRLLLLAKSYLKLGQVENARKVLVKIHADTEARDLDSLLLSTEQTPVFKDEAIKRLEKETNAGNGYILAYNELQSRGFPQAASALLKEGFTKDILSRDGLLSLAQAQIDLRDYKGAEQSLLRAALLDAYYPQTFNQLVITENKLGNIGKAKEYSGYLASISW